MQQGSGGGSRAVVPRVWNNRDPDLPAGAVYVGRPSKWGNPFTHLKKDTQAKFKVKTREEAVENYRQWIEWGGGGYLRKYLEELRGKDLVCWCAPEPCHADVLLGLANAPRPATRPKPASRRSYRDLSRMPAWLLLDAEDGVVASVRAPGAEDAKLLFKTGLPLDDVRAGVRIRRAPGK